MYKSFDFAIGLLQAVKESEEPKYTVHEESRIFQKNQFLDYSFEQFKISVLSDIFWFLMNIYFDGD